MASQDLQSCSSSEAVQFFSFFQETLGENGGESVGDDMTVGDDTTVGEDTTVGDDTTVDTMVEDDATVGGAVIT